MGGLLFWGADEIRFWINYHSNFGNGNRESKRFTVQKFYRADRAAYLVVPEKLFFMHKLPFSVLPWNSEFF